MVEDGLSGTICSTRGGGGCTIGGGEGSVDGCATSAVPDSISWVERWCTTLLSLADSASFSCGAGLGVFSAIFRSSTEHQEGSKVIYPQPAISEIRCFIMNYIMSFGDGGVCCCGLFVQSDTGRFVYSRTGQCSELGCWQDSWSLIYTQRNDNQPKQTLNSTVLIILKRMQSRTTIRRWM